MSVRFESEVARQAGNAAFAAATAASTSSTEAKSTCLVERAGRRVVDRALAAGRAGDDRPPIQWLTRPGAGRRIVAAARFCDLCHGTDLVGCGLIDDTPRRQKRWTRRLGIGPDVVGVAAWTGRRRAARWRSPRRRAGR